MRGERHLLAGRAWCLRGGPAGRAGDVRGLGGGAGLEPVRGLRRRLLRSRARAGPPALGPLG